MALGNDVNTDGYDNTLAALVGKTNNGPVDVVNVNGYDRLCVATSASPATNLIYCKKNLLNGSTINQNVNGSSSNVSYKFTPAAGETWYIEKISIHLSDIGTFSPDQFGVVTTLSNGWQLNIKSNGTVYEIANCKSNYCLTTFYTCVFEGSVFSGGNIVGSITFKDPMILKNSTSDYIETLVRDNLTGLSYLIASATCWKTI